MTIEEEIAQAIANSFFGMEAGYLPTEAWEMPNPSSGDRQLAFDLMPLVRKAQAELLRTYASKRYLAFLEFPERDWLDQPEGTARHYAKVAADMLAEADRIEQNSEGNDT